MAICDHGRIPMTVPDTRMFAHMRSAHPEIWANIAENRLINDLDVIAHELITAADHVDASLHPADDPAIAHLVAVARIAAASLAHGFMV